MTAPGPVEARWAGPRISVRAFVLALFLAAAGPAPMCIAAPPKALPSPAASIPPPVPCREVLATLPSGSLDPAPYLSAAACLRRNDSLAALAGDPEARPPLERGTRERRRPSDSLLVSRLPGEAAWYLSQLERYRSRRDLPHALDMAYLAEMKGPGDARLLKELSSVYLMAQDVYRSALALLRLAEMDSAQGAYLQYQLENLLHQAGSETPASVILDSLTAGFRHVHHRTAEIMESLCWNNRDYPAAYRNYLALKALRDPGPQAALDRAGRFHSLGYFDYAASILDEMDWRSRPQPLPVQARSLHLRIRYQLQDWPAIASEAASSAGATSSARGTTSAEPRGNAPVSPPGVDGRAPASPFSDEETLIIATALLKLGRPGETLARLGDLAEGAPRPPWSFRGRILKAQALTALGKPKDAARTLDALKRDPLRKEGTGPILFWQGCLALDQGRFASAESLMVLASAYTGAEESQRALEYRFYLLMDTGAARPHFFRGLPESPHGAAERRRSLDRVDEKSGLWPFAQLEKAQIHVQNGHTDSAEALFDAVAKRSPDRFSAYHAEAKAAFMAEKLPGGRQAALARYEDLLIKYQQGVIPEFSRGRIKALK